MTRIAVLGAGSWGVALAQLYASNGTPTVLWARRAEMAEQIAGQRESAYLPGVALDARIEAVSDPERLGEATHVLSVVPVQSMRGALTALAPHIRPDARVIVCSKGVEKDSLAWPTDIVADCLPGRPAAVLSGPSFAADVVRGLPTAVTVAAGTLEEASALQALFATPSFRTYPGDDLLGAQIGGAVKNVLAIACGIAVGRGLGESARAALVARGFAEMARLGAALGARAETLAGLSGLGDLVLTCGSERSRNFSAGLRLGNPRYEGAAKGVSEGTNAAEPVIRLAARAGVSMPLCSTVSGVVQGAMTAEDAVTALLARPLKDRE